MAFQQDMMKMFNDVLVGDPKSDVTVLIKKKHDPTEEIVGQFYCHRAILTARSDVFDSMLSKKWQENERKEIEIKDIEKETMEIVLRHIYTSDVPEEYVGLDLSYLVSAADKYHLDFLKDRGVYLMMIMDVGYPSHRIEQLRVAVMHNLGPLKAQLKALCISQLSIDLDRISTKAIMDTIGTGLFAEISQAACKRNRDAMVINLE